MRRSNGVAVWFFRLLLVVAWFQHFCFVANIYLKKCSFLLLVLWLEVYPNLIGFHWRCFVRRCFSSTATALYLNENFVVWRLAVLAIFGRYLYTYIYIFKLKLLLREMYFIFGEKKNYIEIDLTQRTISGVGFYHPDNHALCWCVVLRACVARNRASFASSIFIKLIVKLYPFTFLCEWILWNGKCSI